MPIILNAERVRQGLLKYVSNVACSWSDGRRDKPLVDELVIDEDGIVQPIPVANDIVRDMAMQLAEKWIEQCAVTPITYEWNRLVHFTLAQLYMWYEDGERGDVLCPETLHTSWKALFGGELENRSVTAENMRRLIEGLPVVNLTGGGWLEDPLVRDYSNVLRQIRIMRQLEVAQKVVQH